MSKQYPACGPLYGERDAETLGQHYGKHVHAMTREQLHSKSDIAAELAWRDQNIEQLQARIAELERQADIGRRAVLGLQAIEWSRPVIDRKGFLGPGCIECGRDRERGHTDKCALAAILRDAEQAGMGVEL